MAVKAGPWMLEQEKMIPHEEVERMVKDCVSGHGTRSPSERRKYILLS